MATRKPRLMLTKRYKTQAAAKKATDSWSSKLGVSVGAAFGRSSSSKKRKNTARGPKRGKGGRFVSRKRSRR